MNTQAATKEVCQTLLPGKTYKFDLDKDGKPETIKYTREQSDNPKADDYYRYLFKVTLTINGKEIFKKSNIGSWGNPAQVMVLDTDKKDKQMELIVIQGELPNAYKWDNKRNEEVELPTNVTDSWASNMEHIYYFQYKNGKATNKQDLSKLLKNNFKNAYMLHGMKDSSLLTINGKGEVNARLCLNKLPKNYDYVHIQSILTLKNGTFKIKPLKEFKIVDKQSFICTKEFNTFTKPGKTAKAFSVKKNERIKVTALIRENKNKIYLEVTNSKGKKGYIVPKQGTVEVWEYFHV
jgi:hypothetical protein